MLLRKLLMLPNEHALRHFLAPHTVAGCSAATKTMHAQVVVSRLLLGPTTECVISILGASQSVGLSSCMVQLRRAAVHLLSKSQSTLYPAPITLMQSWPPSFNPCALQMFRWLWWAWAFEFVVWFLICVSLILRWMHRGFAQGLLSLLAVSQCHILSILTLALLSLPAFDHHTIKPDCTRSRAYLSISRLPACSNC